MRGGWALAIGRFIVAFAGCEYWTYFYARTYGSAAENKAVDNQRLSKRLSVVKGILLRMRLTPEVQKRVESAFERFRQLSSTRNILAHNAPMVHVYVNEKTDAMEVRHELRSARDPSKGVTIDQLEKESAELVEIEEEFALLFGLVRKPESHSK